MVCYKIHHSFDEFGYCVNDCFSDNDVNDGDYYHNDYFCNFD